MILLTSVLCVVLSLEFGVATPKGNRFRQSHIQNESNNEFNVVQNMGEPTNPYNTPNNENELLYQENPKNVFMNNEDYEKMYANNNPAAFRDVKKEQRSVISESKEYNRNTGEINFNDFNEPSYIASLPQVNRMQSFRPNNEGNNEVNKETRMADILSEGNYPNTDTAPIRSKLPIQQGNKPANPIMNKYNRPNSQALENFNDKYEQEESTLSDVPVATPEYIRSLYDKPTNRNPPKNFISNKNLQPNSQNANEATFQNPSAEILYETGRAKPYEISNEPSNNSRQGQSNTRNILRDKQKLKNLYLSSKPTKNYMIVYPDGRVEQVDRLDKIQKAHPNYVMLNAKELLQHGKQNTKYKGSQGSVVNQYPPTTTNTYTKPQLNSVKNSNYEQIEKEMQIVEEQRLPAPNDLPVASESPIISTTEVTKINNVVRSSEDQLKESALSESQEKDKFNNNDNTNSETIVTTFDNSSYQVSSTSNSEIPDNEDIVTSSVQNFESNNATSSDSRTVVTNSNTTEIKNSSNENTENDMKPINVTPNPLTNNTSELPEEKQNNNDTTTIKQTVSNVTNSEVNETKNDDNNPKQDGAKNTDDGTGGTVYSKEEDSLAPATASNDNDSPQKVLREYDEYYKENFDTESPNSDENESPIWFNATDSFWKSLMNNEHNTFYFLFPRPQPNTKETKKIMYPNGTVVIETTETIDNGDGEPNSTKTVVTCENCTKCDKN